MSKERCKDKYIDYGGTRLNDVLYPDVLSGDINARNRMIENNLSLVERRVDGFIRQVPTAHTLRDDLIGVGNLALIEAVDDLAESVTQTNPNPTGYLSTAIRNAVKNYHDEESALVSLPSRTKRHRIKQGDEISLPRSEQLQDVAIDSPNESNEILEEILACCESDIERQIVNLKQQGYTVDEAATELKQTGADISSNWIYQLLAKIYQRYEARK